MQTINNITDLLNILNGISNGTFVGVHSLTEPKMRKTGNPFNGHLVQKMSVQTLQWGYNYENAVNNRIGHVGIVTKVDDFGNGFNFIHATVHRGITESHINESYYKCRYMGACRVID